MKSLDEVIKALEWCIDDSHDDCDGCPYDTGEVTDCHVRNIDALHYLKELRDMTDIPMEYFENGGTSQKVRNTSQITCPKCHSEFAILDDPDGDHQQLLKCQALLQDFYRNEPLTWDELCTMEGKPVWVEVDGKWGGRFWAFVEVGNDSYIDFFQKGQEYPEDFGESNMGKTWNAYRKERE